MIKTTTIAILVLLMAGDAYAFTARDLRLLCADKSDADVSMCIGYINGVSDTLRRAGLVCPLPNRYEGAPKAVIAYINENPLFSDRAAVEVATVALREAFPCRE